MDCYFEHFNSIYDFENKISETKRAVNTKFVNNQSSMTKGDESFYGTSSYEEATELLEKGWNKNMASLKSNLKIFETAQKRLHAKTVISVAGYAPVVANAIRGVPKTMYASRKNKKTLRTLHVVFNNTSSCQVTAEELASNGELILKLCMLLEINDIRTQIDVMPKCSFYNSNHDIDNVALCTVKIKDYQQPFNLLKMAYPLSNPSFFRRQGFRFLETLPNAKIANKMGKTYGKSLSMLDKNKYKDILDNYKMENKDTVYIYFQYYPL